MKPQTRAVYTFLCRHKTITPLQALSKLGVYRLAARVDELRKAGIRIETLSERRNGKRFARYEVA
jgi:hypothetical protein